MSWLSLPTVCPKCNQKINVRTDERYCPICHYLFSDLEMLSIQINSFALMMGEMKNFDEKNNDK
jgi:hypothetical protein